MPASSPHFKPRRQCTINTPRGASRWWREATGKGHRSELENSTKVAFEKRSIDHQLKKGIEHVEVCFNPVMVYNFKSGKLLELEVRESSSSLASSSPGLTGIVNLV